MYIKVEWVYALFLRQLMWTNVAVSSRATVAVLNWLNRVCEAGPDEFLNVYESNELAIKNEHNRLIISSH